MNYAPQLFRQIDLSNYSHKVHNIKGKGLLIHVQIRHILTRCLRFSWLVRRKCFGNTLFTPRRFCRCDGNCAKKRERNSEEFTDLTSFIIPHQQTANKLFQFLFSLIELSTTRGRVARKSDNRMGVGLGRDVKRSHEVKKSVEDQNTLKNASRKMGEFKLNNSAVRHIKLKLNASTCWLGWLLPYFLCARGSHNLCKCQDKIFTLSDNTDCVWKCESDENSSSSDMVTRKEVSQDGAAKSGKAEKPLAVEWIVDESHDEISPKARDDRVGEILSSLLTLCEVGNCVKDAQV